jgi:hypothetical protein
MLFIYMNPHIDLDFAACRKAIAGASLGKHIQFLCLAIGFTAIRPSHCIVGVHNKPYTQLRSVSKGHHLGLALHLFMAFFALGEGLLILKPNLNLIFSTPRFIYLVYLSKFRHSPLISRYASSCSTEVGRMSITCDVLGSPFSRGYPREFSLMVGASRSQRSRFLWCHRFYARAEPMAPNR